MSNSESTNDNTTSTKSARIDIIDMYKLLKEHKDQEFLSHIKKADHLDLNHRDNQENYLLTYAIRFNKKEIVKALLNNGARYDVVDRSGRSVIYDAIESDYMTILKIILDHSQNAVGIMVTDIRDSKGSIPLHYAINLKNVTAVKLLIEAESKVYIQDKEGYNALHLAVKTKNIEIVKLATEIITDLDRKTNRGETALHIAINYQFNSITEHLLENGADPNIAEDESYFTPVHYAVAWNNAHILTKLIERGAIVDSQDIYGNTPIVYCIKDQNYQCFDLIIKQNPNLNLWNIDGKIPLHEVLDSYEQNVSDKFIDAIINNSNLAHQDSYGNTCLHYLIHLKLWKKYTNIYPNKKINIFAKNSNHQTVIDLLEKKEDIDELFWITAQSYITLLQTEKEEEWIDEINKICSRDLVDLTDAERKTLKIKKSNKSGTRIDVCGKLIEKKLRETYDKVSSGELQCCQKSYPYNYDMVVDVQEGVMLDITTFTGSLLDVLIGLLYLLKKHDSACSTLDMNAEPNETLCNFYKKMGLIMSGRCEFLNFEILWVEYKLFMIDNFSEYFRNCEKSKARFIIIPLGIEMKTGSHANYLIYDKQIKEIERFEPHGGTMPIGFNYNSSQLDDVLEQFILSINPDIQYIRPEDFIPKIGFQIMDAQESKTHRIGDPGGFCALWGIWYVDQRLSYPHYSREKLIDELFTDIRSKGISYRNLIRNYSRYIIRERDNLLAEVDLDINSWLNERYTNNTLDRFMSILNREIRIASK